LKTLHIAPGDSVGGSLVEAIRDAGLNDEVLRFRDDLSCGPFDSNEPSARAIWWSQFYEEFEVDDTLADFWQRVANTDDRLVLWFGRHSARELAFFLAWVDRLRQRPYQVIDVTGQRLPYTARDGSTQLSEPAQAASIVSTEGLRSLLGTERLITSQERDENAQSWRRLRNENAPFRVITDVGLRSAPIHHFDTLILAHATAEWQKQGRLIGTVMVEDWPYLQVGDLMLRMRVVALVEAGKLLTDGDPWDITSRVRLPR
jgi:hypothetical protein